MFTSLRLENTVVDIVESSTNDEVKDDSTPLEPITRKEVLNTTTLHNYLFITVKHLNVETCGCN